MQLLRRGSSLPTRIRAIRFQDSSRYLFRPGSMSTAPSDCPSIAENRIGQYWCSSLRISLIDVKKQRGRAHIIIVLVRSSIEAKNQDSGVGGIVSAEVGRH